LISGGLFPALMDDEVARSAQNSGPEGRAQDGAALRRPFVAVLAFREPRPILRRRVKEVKARRPRLSLRRKARAPKAPKVPKPRKFLLVFNRKRGWELPGGGLKEGESDAEAAGREFLEETGYEASLVERLVLDNGGVVFLARLGKRKGMPRDEDIKEIRFIGELPKEGLAFPQDEYDGLLKKAREKGY
jgi:8-oxo-dGTP pyrophosphatase MutT (NUDIX family)